MKHPGFEPAVFPKGCAILEDTEKDVLNKVFRDRPVAGHSGKKIKESAVMPVEKYTKLGHIAAPNGQHQVFIVLIHSYVETDVLGKGYQETRLKTGVSRRP